MTAARLTFWSSGGDIFGAAGKVIELEEARQLCALYDKAAENDTDTGARARELRQALETASLWRRAARIAYASGERAKRAANSSREFTLGRSPSGAGTPRKSQSGAQPSATS